MQPAQPISEHKNDSQAKKIKNAIELTVEERRLSRLKAILETKLKLGSLPKAEANSN